ncbi:MAG: hypothetical protein GY756_10230, partial [bacterium]|nr:hypothetical protein [bacterium]
MNSKVEIIERNLSNKYGIDKLKSLKKHHWKDISEKDELCDEFIEKYKNCLNWESMSKYQKLTEDCIKKHIDKVNWKRISIFQNLSEAFIKEHKELI